MVMSTGDELADFDEALTENKIPNSNSFAVATQVLETGAHPHVLGIARDNKESLREKENIVSGKNHPSSAARGRRGNTL